MAFNFNWSPLTADAEFYSRAQDLLTTALNKSPKPPIIVDDILVNELNLGSVPPELEILEIGDLAEDRFRGIFKMCYSGDAFLTLKTRVQVSYTTSTTLHTSFHTRLLSCDDSLRRDFCIELRIVNLEMWGYNKG
jgi:distribution and morphology protein 34